MLLFWFLLYASGACCVYVCVCVCAESLSLIRSVCVCVCTDKWKLTTAEQQRPDPGVYDQLNQNPRLTALFFLVVVVAVVVVRGGRLSVCVDCPFIGSGRVGRVNGESTREKTINLELSVT